MTPRTRTLVVIVVLLVAGVGGAGNTVAHGVAPSMDTESAAAESESAPMPPGTSTDGIDNATALVDAHLAALADATYTQRSVWEDVGPEHGENGSVIGTNVSRYTIAAVNGTNGSGLTITGPRDFSSYWYTDSVVLTQMRSPYGQNTSTIYQSVGYDSRYASHTPDPAEFGVVGVVGYLRDLEYDLVNTTTRDDRTFYTYTATTINETVEPNIGDTPVTTSTQNISASVTIDDRGVIHAFAATETLLVNNETVRLHHQYTLTEGDETAVRAPAWTTTEIAHVNLSVLENGSVVAFSHSGGAVLTDPTVNVFTSVDGNSTVANGTVGPGDTVYVYLTANESGVPTAEATINDYPSTFVSSADFSSSIPYGSAYRILIGDYDSGVVLEAHGQVAKSETASSDRSDRRGDSSENRTRASAHDR